jgi:hypothetical protein
MTALTSLNSTWDSLSWTNTMFQPALPFVTRAVLMVKEVSANISISGVPLSMAFPQPTPAPWSAFP